LNDGSGLPEDVTVDSSSGEPGVSQPPSAPPVDLDPPRLSRERVGAYELLELIGEGGFGSVFVAEQHEPVRRRVALKILKLGMNSLEIVARFEQERQALAILDHPNIAKVFDAGTTETGRPYFVMELCEGERIDTFCDRERLSIDARLGLFVQVCAAVQHAHTKGIIHRDIKPSNVLVSMRDGEPRAKVIDFGIAKATTGRSEDEPQYTERGQLIGTLEYMSPEQAMGSLDIDTRTDVYALGVLLYQLLTGGTPFRGEDLRSSSYADIQRVISEQEPPRPSTRLTQSASALAEIASNRQSDPQRLRGAVRGELDWIALKAMEKDRQRRYESASALALDVQRYLRGEAVEAAPPSGVYRARKMIRRNRGLISAAGAVAGALVIGMVAFAWQARVAAHERDAARESGRQQLILRERAEESERHARDVAAEADRARQRAELIAGFMSETLGGAGPSIAQGQDTAMLKEMMDRAGARIEAGELAGAPEAELRLRETIGVTYRELGELDSSAGMLEPAVAMARAIHEGDHPTTAEALTNLGRLRRAQGDSEGAEGAFREALGMNERLSGPGHVSVATSMNDLAFALRAQGEDDAGERLLRESLAIYRGAYAGDHPSVATGMNDLAVALHDRGAYKEAEPLYRESLAMRERLFPGDHPDVAPALNNLGRLLQARGDTPGAEPYLRASLEMWKRLYGGDHPDVAVGLNNLARLQQSMGELELAEGTFRESLAMSERLLPGEHPQVAAILNNLAFVVKARGDLDEAERLLRRSLAIKRVAYSDDHTSVANSLTTLGLLLVEGDRPEEAEPLLAEAHQIYERSNGAGHASTTSASVRHASVLTMCGRFGEAESELLAVESRMAADPEVLARRYRRCLEALVRLYETWGEHEPGPEVDAKGDAWRAKLHAFDASGS